MLEMKHNVMADVTSGISFIAAKRLMDKSGEGAVKFPYFEIMHSVLKNTAIANPLHVIDTQENTTKLEENGMCRLFIIFV